MKGVSVSRNPMRFPSLLTLLCALWFLPAAALGQKQGAELLKTDILTVLAHPDDETGMASTLAYYAHGRQATLANVYCTRGEGGGNMVGTHWGPSLGVLRQVELQHCLDALGVAHCFFLGQLDWAYTESAAMTLEKWDQEAALSQLVRLIRCLRPEVILTMNPFPRPGQHGHHQAAGMLAVEAYTAAGDPSQFPQQLEREGLEPWQARKLYFRGESVGAVAKIDAGRPLPDGRNAHAIAGEALRHHRSQGFGRFQRSTLGRPPETFGLIKSVLTVAAEETDLLAGLPLASDNMATVLPPPPRNEPAFSMSFTPRPAITRFRQWARAQNILHLVDEIPSDLPLPTGQASQVSLTLRNRSAAPRQLNISMESEHGWAVSPKTFTIDIAANATVNSTLTVTPPAGTREAITLRAVIADGPSGYRVETQLHPLPTEVALRTTSPPDLAQASSAWERAAVLAITPDQRVQGKTEGPRDSSGDVRVLYDDEFLYTEVRVRDDRVVSNIAPNDIRGHWRTDAVEICVDPTAQSEHTLTCFKVGIFPFDQTGATRAARDADALQGPIEETAPKMRVEAERDSDGYTLRAAIPWESIGLDRPEAGHTLGFNVILYDGDKAEAATGENINESRLAWAPRPGVQGRPEDWGKLTLR